MAERDAWYALEEYRSAICPRCGNFKAVCSQPGGATGEGYNISQDVCYATAVLESTQRRIGRKFEKAQPDMQGSLPTDGVSIAVTLMPDDSEDVLGLGEKSDAERLLAQQTPGDESQPGAPGDK